MLFLLFQWFYRSPDWTGCYLLPTAYLHVK